MTQIRKKDVTSIVTRMVLQLALVCLEDDTMTEWQGHPHRHERRPRRRLDPRKMYDPAVEAHGTFSQETVNSQSDINQKKNMGQRILSALCTLDQNDRTERQENLLDRQFSFPLTEPAAYRKAAQFVQVLRSVAKALVTGKIRQARSIYYDNVTLFDRNAERAKECLDKLSKYWKVHSSLFNILSGSRGLYAGPLWIESNLWNEVNAAQSELVCASQSSTAARLNPDGDNGTIVMTDSHLREYASMVVEDPIKYCNVRFASDIPWVLIVEKETIFNERIQELNRLRVQVGNNGGKGFGLIVTSRGFPDHTTRRFLSHLREKMPSNTPFYTLMDADAYGMHISQSFQIPSNHVDSLASRPLMHSLQWIGLRPTLWRQYIAIIRMQSISGQSVQTDRDDLPYSNEQQENSSSQAFSTSDQSVSPHPAYDTDPCVPLNASEYQRALGLMRRKDVPRALQRELCKLVQLGFKLELESAKHIPLHMLLPNPAP